MTTRRLTEKQIEIIRQLRSIVLELMLKSGKKRGKTIQIFDLYRGIAHHFSTTVDKVVELGNEWIWSTLYLLELQGWVRIDFQHPRVYVVRTPKRDHHFFSDEE